MPRNWNNKYSFGLMEQKVYVRERVEIKVEIRKRTEALNPTLTT